MRYESHVRNIYACQVVGELRSEFCVPKGGVLDDEVNETFGVTARVKDAQRGSRFAHDDLEDPSDSLQGDCR